jgi:hypothetical protein
MTVRTVRVMTVCMVRPVPVLVVGHFRRLLRGVIAYDRPDRRRPEEQGANADQDQPRHDGFGRQNGLRRMMRGRGGCPVRRRRRSVRWFRGARQRTR